MSNFLSSLRDPSGHLISAELKQKITNELKTDFKNDPKEFLALYIEDLFFEFRYTTDGRKPDKNDPRDIEHIICGLTSSDYFITCDNNMLRFCDAYTKSKSDNLPDYENNFNFLEPTSDY